eukprot:SAG22_NODE_3942_length_1456_cov_1.737657_1_plen_244_part_00
MYSLGGSGVSASVGANPQSVSTILIWVGSDLELSIGRCMYSAGAPTVTPPFEYPRSEEGRGGGASVAGAVRMRCPSDRLWPSAERNRRSGPATRPSTDSRLRRLRRRFGGRIVTSAPAESSTSENDWTWGRGQAGAARSGSAVKIDRLQPRQAPKSTPPRPTLPGQGVCAPCPLPAAPAAPPESGRLCASRPPSAPGLAAGQDGLRTMVPPEKRKPLAPVSLCACASRRPLQRLRDNLAMHMK